MSGKILSSLLKPVTTSGKSSLSAVLTEFWIHLCINYFRKTIPYLFTKFDWHIPPYISIVQSHLTLCSTYLLKVGLSPSKKLFLLFASMIVFQKMMKNAFYFILRALFVLEIFRFLFWLFGHVEKTAWLER